MEIVLTWSPEEGIEITSQVSSVDKSSVMFSSLGLFRKISCPGLPGCDLPNCAFCHSENHKPSDLLQETTANQEDDGHRSKRLKLAEDCNSSHESTKSANRPFYGALVNSPSKPSMKIQNRNVEDIESSSQNASATRRSTQRSISPPSSKRSSIKKAAPRGSQPIRRTATLQRPLESLNPRMLAKPPAAHPARMAYVQKLHEFMTRLNGLARESKDPAVKVVEVSDAEVVRLVLGEEESVAKEFPSTYNNIIKHRIAALKKMTIEQWTELRQKNTSQTAASTRVSSNAAKPIPTGLSVEEELQVLPELISKQHGLEKYGYVTSPPRDIDIVETRAAVALCRGYEECDRCGSRFQVFPQRNEDGALTQGGRCTHHPGRAYFPERNGNQAADGPKERRYSCCSEPLGASTGCTTSETHVFKVSDPKRLGSVLQFQRTPENATAPINQAVAFDCEMCYTVYGMELIRLTAVAWPSNEQLIDVLVKPLGAILDLNTRFSGVSADIFTNALPHEQDSNASSRAISDDRLRIVESPAAARQLLFNTVTPSTPLLGHAIENDLIATRIVHPNIVDTVLLYPHSRGLPNRKGLRALAKENLDRAIQVAGPAGHDSKEDAIAAGDLIRLAVGKKWVKMQKAGYKFVDGKLVAPAGKGGMGSLADKLREDVREMKAVKEAKVNVKKRKEETPEKEDREMYFWQD